MERALVVEVDGGQHNQSEADRLRDAWLASQGLRVIRFWNNDVLQNTDGVLQRIEIELGSVEVKPLSRRAARATLSRSGRGETEY